MTAKVEYLLNNASLEEIEEHLRQCDADFVPLLSSRVEINDYANKIVRNAMRFEAWSKGVLIGLVAVYCNDWDKGIAYITSVSLIKNWMGKGIAVHLMDQCIMQAKMMGMSQVSLEVSSDNISAIKLYEKCGFIAENANVSLIAMNLNLRSGEEYEQQA